MIRETTALHHFVTDRRRDVLLVTGQRLDRSPRVHNRPEAPISWNSGSRRASRAAGDARTVGCSSRLSNAMAVATDSSAFEFIHSSMKLLRKARRATRNAHICRPASAVGRV